MQRLPVARHRRAGQARATYRACSHPVAKTRWHAIGLRLRGDRPRCPAEVAEVVGRSALTVRDALRRCNAHGPGGLADRRPGHGAKPQLTAGPRAELFAARRRPPDGGRWTGPKVARCARDRWGVAVRPQTGGPWLRDLGYTPQVPRPSHPRAADAAAKARGEKTGGGGGGGSGGGRTPARRWRCGPRTRAASGSSRSPAAPGP